ncbi:MAG: hypothetical protein ACRDT2_19805, partial [Natronosporangium sp.]
PELVRLHSTGERRGEAATAMTRLLADGVDPDDQTALTAWLAGQQPPTGAGDNGSNHIPRPR